MSFKKVSGPSSSYSNKIPGFNQNDNIVTVVYPCEEEVVVPPMADFGDPIPRMKFVRNENGPHFVVVSEDMNPTSLLEQ